MRKLGPLYNLDWHKNRHIRAIRHIDRGPLYLNRWLIILLMAICAIFLLILFKAAGSDAIFRL